MTDPRNRRPGSGAPPDAEVHAPGSRRGPRWRGPSAIAPAVRAEAEDWFCIDRASRRAPMEEGGFVLTAVGIDNRVDADADGWGLWVRTADAERAGRELAAYRRDQSSAAAAEPRPVPEIDSGVFGILGYLAVIWAVPAVEPWLPLAWDLLDLGRMQAGLVADGEWWRCLTALTLHGGFDHILANSVFGALFGALMGRYLGSGLGWLLVVVAGACGNGLNAWIQPDRFASIGASTATFAALGVVAAYMWGRGFHRRLGWRRSLGPLFAGFAMLVWTGVGGENTDVMAHFTGFACGVVAGVAGARLRPERLSRRIQVGTGLTALGLILLGWLLAVVG